MARREITIVYDGGWSFSPIGPVKHMDSIYWTCPDYDWTVFFKKDSPLKSGSKTVIGKAGQTNGGRVDPTAPARKHYPWGAEVKVGNGTERSPDPDIVIDDNPDQSKHHRRKSKAAGAVRKSGKKNLPAKPAAKKRKPAKKR